MSQIEELREFLRKNLPYMIEDTSSGTTLNFPDFELMPHDYLSFADAELSRKDTGQRLINSVTHLKRAAECEFDTFLYVCNLYKIISKNNLGFDVKLKFFADIGIFSSRTLSRFNIMRNKIEHEYGVPKIEDIEVYYDLVSALIDVLEGAMFMMASGSELGFIIKSKDLDGEFEIIYGYNEPSITARWKIGEESKELKACLKDNRDEFIYFFKILFLLNKYKCLVNHEWVLEFL